MDQTPRGYTTRTAVEQLLHRTFSEVATAEFNVYLAAAEREVDNYLGYNSALALGAVTTSSGILTQTVTKEKGIGAVDSYGNIVVRVKHGPVHVDADLNPVVTYLSINGGLYDISLPLTNGGSSGHTSILELDSLGRTVFYPAQFVIAAISSITPTAKFSFGSLRSVQFWTDISYTGGYDDVPGDIALAACYLTADKLVIRDNVNQLQAFSQGSLSETFKPKTVKPGAGIPASQYQELAYRLLQPYVRVTW